MMRLKLTKNSKYSGLTNITLIKKKVHKSVLYLALIADKIETIF